MKVRKMMKNEKDLEPIKNLQFTITDDMRKTIFQLLLIQQMLDSEELSKREEKILEKQKFELLDDFRTKLQQLNPAQILVVRKFLSD